MRREERKQEENAVGEIEEEARKMLGNAREEGVWSAILVGVNICRSACQGSIYRDGLIPGLLVEY